MLKLLKMEATTKASEAAAASAGTTDAAAGSSQAAVDSGGTVSLDNNSDFYNTGRVGRRNALPDILNHHHSTTSTADLPDKLSALSTTGEEGVLLIMNICILIAYFDLFQMAARQEHRNEALQVMTVETNGDLFKIEF